MKINFSLKLTYPHSIKQHLFHLYVGIRGINVSRNVEIPYIPHLFLYIYTKYTTLRYNLNHYNMYWNDQLCQKMKKKHKFSQGEHYYIYLVKNVKWMSFKFTKCLLRHVNCLFVTMCVSKLKYRLASFACDLTDFSYVDFVIYDFEKTVTVFFFNLMIESTVSCVYNLLKRDERYPRDINRNTMTTPSLKN